MADDQGTSDVALTATGMLALGLLGGVGWARVLGPSTPHEPVPTTAVVRTAEEATRRRAG
jgi:hypothetical protein